MPRASRLKYIDMVDETVNSEFEDEDLALIAKIAEQAFGFGVACARPVDPEVFDDPVMHNYYLFFVFGAILWLGDNIRPARPLNHQQKLSALSQAMSFLEPESKQKIRSLVLMVGKVEDTFAHNTMREGADAVRRLLVDKDEDATLRFSELLEDPALFPHRIDPDADRIEH